MRSLKQKAQRILSSGKRALYGHSFVARMLLVITVATVLLLIALTVIVSRRTTDILLRNEISNNDIMLGDVDAYLAEQDLFVRSIIQQAYLDMLQLSTLGQPSAYAFLATTALPASDEYIASKKAFDHFFKSIFAKDGAIRSISIHKRSSGSFYYFSRTSSAIIDQAHFAGRRFVRDTEQIGYADLTGELFRVDEPLERASQKTLETPDSYVIAMPMIMLPTTPLGTLVFEFSARALSARLDMPLWEASRCWAPGKVLIGGIEPPSLRFSSVRDTLSSVAETLKLLPDKCGVILSTGDAVPYGAPMENLKVISRLVQSLGQGALKEEIPQDTLVWALDQAASIS